jgi:hypothetical protein
MEMAMAHEFSAQTAIKEKIKEAISTKKALPDNIKIGKKLIAVSDVASQVKSFGIQFELLKETKNPWPCVEVDFTSSERSIGIAFVPIDLRDGIVGSPSIMDPTLKRDPTLAEIATGTIQLNAAKRATQSGLSVKEIDYDQAKKSFMDILSEFLFRRGSETNTEVNFDPPEEDFTVETDEPKIEILYATGYFISTRQGFGISTPATKRLKWGPYIFGMNKPNGFKFSETLWVVPDVKNIYLRL